MLWVVLGVYSRLWVEVLVWGRAEWCRLCCLVLHPVDLPFRFLVSGVCLCLGACDMARACAVVGLELAVTYVGMCFGGLCLWS